MKSAQLYTEMYHWSLLGLYCSEKVAKDFLILQNPTVNYPKHSRL